MLVRKSMLYPENCSGSWKVFARCGKLLLDPIKIVLVRKKDSISGKLFYIHKIMVNPEKLLLDPENYCLILKIVPDLENCVGSEKLC